MRFSSYFMWYHRGMYNCQIHQAKQKICAFYFMQIISRLQSKQNKTKIQNLYLWLPRGRGCEGGMDWEFGISRCKLLYIEWVNKVLLYSTGNYIQYPVINHNGKEYKNNVYMYN